jgi:hypothetical protein
LYVFDFLLSSRRNLFFFDLTVRPIDYPPRDLLRDDQRQDSSGLHPEQKASVSCQVPLLEPRRPAHTRIFLLDIIFYDDCDERTATALRSGETVPPFDSTWLRSVLAAERRAYYLTYLCCTSTYYLGRWNRSKWNAPQRCDIREQWAFIRGLCKSVAQCENRLRCEKCLCIMCDMLHIFVVCNASCRKL